MQRRVGKEVLGWSGLAVTFWTLGLLIFLALGSSSPVLAFDDGQCVYNRQVYAEGTVMCQGSQRLRCDAGSWGQIGICHGHEAFPEPISSGGDREEEPEQ